MSELPQSELQAGVDQECTPCWEPEDGAAGEGAGVLRLLLVNHENRMGGYAPNSDSGCFWESGEEGLNGTKTEFFKCRVLFTFSKYILFLFSLAWVVGLSELFANARTLFRM